MPLNGKVRPHEQLPRNSVMVTGASGFIGARIVKRLVKDGWPVLAVVRNLGRHSHILKNAGMSVPHNAVKTIECDLHDVDAVDRMIVCERPAACIHAAWSVNPDSYRDDAENLKWISTSVHLLESLQRHGCKWLGVLGTCIEPQIARGERASCCYAVAKSELHQRLNDWLIAGRSNDLSLCWWRIFQPYGPGEPAQRLIPSMLDALKNDRPFLVRTPHEVRDFIHVDDIAAAICSSLRHRVHGTFDLGTGVGHRILHAAQMLADELESHHLLRWLHDEPDNAAESAGASIADIQTITAATGWKPAIDLRTGLEQLIKSSPRRRRLSA
jgi:UDP-glucuronate decarboxylase